MVTDGTIFPTHRLQVSYVVRYSINRDRVLAVNSRYRALAKLCCASPIQILHPDSISLHVQARNCIVRYQRHVDTLDTDLVGVGCIRWCSRGCFIIIRRDVVPIHHLRDRALHSCRNAFVRWDLSTIPFPDDRWAH